MKFEDDPIGGKETGPIRFSFAGDRAGGEQLASFGQAVLGALKQRMWLGGIQTLNQTVRLDDGSVVYVSSILGLDGAADINHVSIFVPVKKGKKKTEGAWKCLGFVAEAFGDVGAAKGVYVLAPGLNYRFTQITSGHAANDWPLFGMVQELLVPSPRSAIPLVYMRPEQLPENIEGGGTFSTHIPIFWLNSNGSGSGWEFFGEFCGSVQPITINDIFAFNAAQTPVVPFPSGYEYNDTCPLRAKSWSNAKYRMIGAAWSDAGHVALVSNLTEVTRSSVTFGTTVGAAISVLPGEVEYIPDPISWGLYFSETVAPSKDYIVEDIMTVHRDFLEGVLSEGVLSDPILEGQCGFNPTFGAAPGACAVSAIYARGTSTNNLGPITGFTANVEVPTGVHSIAGNPSIRVHAIMESTVGEVALEVFEFEGTEFLKDFISLEVGRYVPTKEELIRRERGAYKFVSRVSEDDGLVRTHWVFTD